MTTSNHVEDKRAERLKGAERLRQARINAGFKSMPDAARAARVNIPSYKTHEMGINGFDLPHARIYAQIFGVPLAWLMTGEGGGPTQEGVSDPLPIVVPAEAPATDNRAERRERADRLKGALFEVGCKTVRSGAELVTSAEIPAQDKSTDKPLSIAEAKRRLALTFGVDPSSIKITIEA